MDVTDTTDTTDTSPLIHMTNIDTCVDALVNEFVDIKLCDEKVTYTKCTCVIL